MVFPLYQIDAFTDAVFGGNPACVVPLENWLEDAVLLKIAQENAVAETAFFIERNDHFELRWFTPEIEMDLCGHATLATAHAIYTLRNYNKSHILFKTVSGNLSVGVNDGMYTLEFPRRKAVDAILPEEIKKALNIQPKKVLKSRDYILVYEQEEDIRNIVINRAVFDTINLDPGGVAITAKGNHCDFVSRYFTPQSSILEDPVTGSSHCSLIPYWSDLLNKKEMTAMQLSERSGTLHCVDQNESVLISGQAKTYSVGNIYL